MNRLLVLGLITLIIISCKPQLVKTGSRTIAKDYKILGDKIYKLSKKCWDREQGILEVTQIVNREVNENIYSITVHRFQENTAIITPFPMFIKGKGELPPFFKATLTNLQNKTTIQFEEKGIAYGERGYFTKEVNKWIDGQNRCTHRR